MKLRLALFLASISGTVLPPSLLATETRVGSLDVSLLYSSEDNVRAHRFHDLEAGGLLLDTGFNYLTATPLGNLQMDATHLGLGTRALTLQLDRTGAFELEINYDESVFNDAHDGSTPYAGTGTLLLPASWQPGILASSFDQGAFTENLYTGNRRRNLEVSLVQELSDNLRTALTVAVHSRKGTRLQGSAIYFNAANPQAAMLPMPIDETSIMIEWEAGFRSGAYDGQVSWRYTDFDNHVRSLRWQNPYSSGLGAAVDHPAGFGELASDPGFRQHLLHLGANYSLNHMIRFSLDTAWSRTRQTDRLLGYTTNPALSVPQAPPVFKMDEPLTTRSLTMLAYLQPRADLDVDVRYEFEDRDNEADRLPWRYVRGDGRDQPAAQFAVFNTPLNFERERLAITSRLRLPSRSRLSLTYGIERRFRNYAAVEDTEEERFHTAFRFSLGPEVRHRLEAEYRNRAGSTYEWSRSFFQRLAVPLINLVPDDQRWSEHPELRQFHLANREVREFRYQGTWQTAESWQLQWQFDGELANFDKSNLGLRNEDSGGGNLALSWFPGDRLSVSTHLDHRRHKRDQRGRAFSGGLQKPANQVTGPLSQGSDPARNYDIQETSDITGLGVDLNWTLKESLQLDAAYAAHFAETRFRYDTLLAHEPLDRIETIVHSVEGRLTWQYSAALQLMGSYAFFRYEDIDELISSAASGALEKVVTSGIRNPNETVSTLIFSANFVF